MRKSPLITTPSGFRNDPCSQAAFTRLELAAVLCALSLLALLALPVLAGSRPAASRATCVNNLSRIGQGFSMWANEHAERYPWQVQADPGAHTLHFPDYYRAVSNEFVTTRILVCPVDPARTVASSFAMLGFGTTSISYMLAHPFAQEGRAILSGDRNLTGSTTATSCSSFISPRSIPNSTTNASWGNDLHYRSGQLLFNDGSVEQTGDTQLRARLANRGYDDTAFHFLIQ